MDSEFSVVREGLTVYRLETMMDLRTDKVILRGLFDYSDGKRGYFSQQFHSDFDGFTPKQLYFYVEDDNAPYIRYWIREKLKEGE